MFPEKWEINLSKQIGEVIGFQQNHARFPIETTVSFLDVMQFIENHFHFRISKGRWLSANDALRHRPRQDFLRA